mgnify:CR=1 FL=1
MNLRPTLEGKLVVLEPLTEKHADGVRSAASDPRTWTWMTTLDPEAWLAAALSATEVHHFAVIRDGEVVGSSSYLNVFPEHKRLEIGHTWNHPSVWGTGVNTEAKYLLIGHAIETLGMHRVEWPDDDAVEFHLPHGELIALLRDTGFEVEGLVEIRPPEGSTTTYDFVSLDWARQWPSEEAWRVLKR